MIKIKAFIQLLCMLPAFAFAQMQMDNETIQELLQKVQSMPVTPTTQPTKDYALSALKNSIQAFCMAHGLDFKQCSKKQASEMRAWFEAQAKREQAEKRAAEEKQD
jgi:hypothetical protein